MIKDSRSQPGFWVAEPVDRSTTLEGAGKQAIGCLLPELLPNFDKISARQLLARHELAGSFRLAKQDRAVSSERIADDSSKRLIVRRARMIFGREPEIRKFQPMSF